MRVMPASPWKLEPWCDSAGACGDGRLVVWPAGGGFSRFPWYWRVFAWDRGFVGTPRPWELAAPARLWPLLPEGVGGLLAPLLPSEPEAAPLQELCEVNVGPRNGVSKRGGGKRGAGKGLQKALRCSAFARSPVGFAGLVAAGFGGVREAILGIYLNT